MVIALVVGTSLVVMELKTSSVTKDFVKQINTTAMYTWNAEKLHLYESQIIDEMKNMRYEGELQEAYYALGYIEGLKFKFEQSNDYYFQALELSDECYLTICGNIYQELAYNFLVLNDVERAKEYFYLTEDIANVSYNEQLKSSLYNRISQALIEHTNYVSSVTPLLELVIEENVSKYDVLNAYRLLTNLYLLSGYYEKSMDHLIEAYKLSVQEDCDVAQREVKIKLGQAYFLNEEYKQANLILKDCVTKFRVYDFISYIPQLVDSYRIVDGYETAIEFLDEYVSQSSNAEEGWTEFWYLYIRCDLAIKEGILDEAQFFLTELEDVYEKTTYLHSTQVGIWKDKLQLDYLVATGIRNEKVIEQYELLYENIKGSDLYVTAKVNLLEDIVSQSVKISNYHLGYRYLNERLTYLKGSDQKTNILPISEIYEKTLRDLKQSRVEKIIVIGCFSILAVATSSLIVYFIWKKQTQIQALSKEIKLKQDIDNLTNTLTKEALYDCLEIHMGQDDILNFMVVNIDDFKRYNEVYGYLEGDKVLQILAQQIKLIFPEAYVARHAGDHFIIVSANDNSTSLLKLEYLIEQIYYKNIPNKSNLIDHRVMISAGFSSGKILTRLQVDQHINQATYKLELSKKRGTNKVTM